MPDAAPAPAMARPPRLRDSVMLFGRPGNVVDVLFTASRKVSTFQMSDMGLALVALLEQEIARPELIAEMGTRGFPEAEVDALLRIFDQEGLLERDSLWGTGAPSEPTGYFDRRNRFLYELAHQATGPSSTTVDALGDRLAAASVLLIGLGGMGTWLARSLAGIGVGRLVICDPDRVAVENLAHQLLFDPADVGRPKVDAAADVLRRLCPQTQIDAHRSLVIGPADLDCHLEGGLDFVVAAGNIPTANALAELVAGACQRHGVPHSVGAGYAHANGTLGLTVIPGVTPCWDCLQRAVDDPLFGEDATLIRTYREPVGMIPMFPSILANYLAWEIARVLLGAPPLLAGHACELDFETMQVRSRAFEPSLGCGCTDGGAR